MPKRLLRWSREEPARSILFCVSVLTALLQIAAVILFVGSWLTLLIVLPICAWCIWSSGTNNIKNEARSSFWLFAVWLWSGLSQLLFAGQALTLLWAPFVIVAVAVAICHIYLTAQKKAANA